VADRWSAVIASIADHGREAEGADEQGLLARGRAGCERAGCCD
jgi:hypothetical protein